MKKSLPLLLILLFFFTSSTFSQSELEYFDLEVYPGLTSLNIPQLIASENLKSSTRVFRVTMSPEGIPVTMRGTIHWTPPGGMRVELANFTTQTFESISFANTEASKLENIDVEGDGAFDDDVLEDLIKRGKLTGVIEIELFVSDARTGKTIRDFEILSFLNPVQTLTIRSPFPGSSENVGSAILEWDKVAGAAGYVIRANVRKNEDQSFEEALASGNPVIDDVEVSASSTRANMRQILSREWLLGQEIVVQVSAIVESAGGDQELKSDIVNFFINDPNKVVQGQITDPEEFLNEIMVGNIKLDEIKRIAVDGKRIPPQEILRLIAFLKANPDLIISKRFIRK